MHAGDKFDFSPSARTASPRIGHAGKSCSPHYWELSSEFVISTVEWDLEHNSLFEVLSDAGHMVVLRQHKGLPIGGHLSAALVELVALYREATQPRPSLFSSVLTARYRDNYFCHCISLIPVPNARNCRCAIAALAHASKTCRTSLNSSLSRNPPVLRFHRSSALCLGVSNGR